MTSNILNNRTAIKYDTMVIDSNKPYVTHQQDQGSEFTMGKVRTMFLDGDFHNIVYVSLSDENGSYGKDSKPSRKNIKRLLSIIKDTNYKIISQQGQVFVLEGVN